MESENPTLSKFKYDLGNKITGNKINNYETFEKIFLNYYIAWPIKHDEGTGLRYYESSQLESK